MNDLNITIRRKNLGMKTYQVELAGQDYGTIQTNMDKAYTYRIREFVGISNPGETRMELIIRVIEGILEYTDPKWGG